VKRTQRNKIDQVKSAERTMKTISERFKDKPYPNLLPKTENQSLFLNAMRKYTLVAAAGTAGVGKTLLACWYAGKLLQDGTIKKIVLLRAYQPLANRTAGLVPGDANQKLMPHYIQMVEYLKDFIGKGAVEYHIENGTIEIASLETIRGRNWEDSCVIIDESQNLVQAEVQAITTRIGDNCKVFMCGDNSGFQNDKKGFCGLNYLRSICYKYSIQDCAFVQFNHDDIQRSGIVRDFVIAYEQELKGGN